MVTPHFMDDRAFPSMEDGVLPSLDDGALPSLDDGALPYMNDGALPCMGGCKLHRLLCLTLHGWLRLPELSKMSGTVKRVGG